MADVVGFLSVLLKGARQTFVGSGLTVYQPVDAGMIAGDGILFDVKGDDLGWYYDGGTTDTVYLITTDGDSVTLTRKGDYFMWEIGANDLRTPATAPSADASFTAQIVVDRVLAGVRTRLTSKSFTLTVKRQLGFVPGSISGLVAHFDAYDLSAIAEAAVVPTWDDGSQNDNDLTEATNRPTKQLTGVGRPYVAFDGTNDVMASELSNVGLASTVFVVAKLGAYDATVRGIVQAGGTNGARIAFDNANLKGISGSDIANTTLPSLDTWFVAVATKTASGAITIQKGTGSPVSQASTAAVTAGTITVGDTAADAVADVDIAEILVYDSVLTSTQIERVVRSLQLKWQATG